MITRISAIILILLPPLFWGCADLSPMYGDGTGKTSFLQMAERFRHEAVEYEEKGELYKSLLRWRIVQGLEPDDEESAERVRELKKRCRQSAEEHFQKGLSLYRKNSLKASRREFLTALVLNPGHEDALRLLRDIPGRSDFKTYETRQGDTLKKIARRYYGDDGKDFLIAQVNGLDMKSGLKEGVTLKLIVLDKDLTRKKPVVSKKARMTDEMLARAQASFKEGKYQQALSFVRNVLNYDITNKKAAELLNACYYRMGVDRLAKKDYREALAMLNNLDQDYMDVADLIAGARTYLRREADSHYSKGLAYFIDEELNQAIKEWEMALSLDPQHDKAARDLAKARRLLENLRKIR